MRSNMLGRCLDASVMFAMSLQSGSSPAYACGVASSTTMCARELAHHHRTCSRLARHALVAVAPSQVGSPFPSVCRATSAPNAAAVAAPPSGRQSATGSAPRAPGGRRQPRSGRQGRSGRTLALACEPLLEGHLSGMLPRWTMSRQSVPGQPSTETELP